MYLTCLAAVIHLEPKLVVVWTRISQNGPPVINITVVFAITSALYNLHGFQMSTTAATPRNRVRDNHHVVIATEVAWYQPMAFRSGQ